jgi:hypothetical protein
LATDFFLGAADAAFFTTSFLRATFFVTDLVADFLVAAFFVFFRNAGSDQSEGLFEDFWRCLCGH